MRFSAGVRLGPYEIVAPIGAGGMGEVYSARDTRLDRMVAVKVLPEHVARDAVLRDRFEREARAISQLNHPHICTLYDIGRENPSTPSTGSGQALSTGPEQAVDFLVMEYLDGETLASRLAAGRLPLDQALRYGVEIADALDKAHRQGIVHRDLKPGNVMVSKSGTKLLDFGLARLTPTVTGASGATGLLTTPAHLTAHGTILGTFQYMAPEQLEGKASDARSDIFALGAVLYEMLTGRKAFEGTSQASVIAAILDRDPPPISTLVPMTSPALDRVVKTCLAKDPDERFQSARDLVLQLRWVSEADPLAPVPPAVAAPPSPHSRRSMRWWMAACAALVVAILALAAMLYVQPSPTSAPEMRVDIVTPSTPDPVSFAVSPDNRRIVFVASGDGPPRLWLRPLDAVTAQPLPGTEGATYPFWSPDGRAVGFFAGTKLKRIDINGGVPQNLADALNGRGGTWNADGVILFAPNTSMPLFRVPATGGEATPATKLDGPRQTSHRFPHFLPGGRQFLFYATGVVDARGVYLGSFDASDTKRLTAADTPAAYAPPGWLLFVRQGTLVARRFEPSRAELTGDPVSIAESVGFDGSVIAGAFSVSAAGLVAYRAGASRRQLTWFDRSGKPVGTLGAPDENSLANPELSPDGRKVMVDRNVQSNIDVWLLDTARASRFTFDVNSDNFPIWSLDGTRIVFRSNRKGAFDLYQRPLSGDGGEELLVESPQVKTPLDWSPDGRFLLYQSVDPKTSTDLWVLPTFGDRKPFVFLSTNFEERYAQFSPDGQWVAYQSNQAGQDEIYVRRFPGPGGQWQTSTAGGRLPRWRPDGKELYYIAPDGKLMAVPIEARSTTIEAGSAQALFQTRIIFGPSSTQRQQYDVAPDGRFLINVPTEDTASSPITLLLNWKPPASTRSR